MQECVLYIAEGEMGLVEAGKARTLPSQRLQQYERTMRQLEEKHAWKTEGQGAQFMGKHNPYSGAAQQKGRVTAATSYEDGMVYAALTGDSGSLYTKNPADLDEPEGLLYSDRRFDPDDLCAQGSRLALSLGQANGERHIALFIQGKAGYRVLTEGDTVERYPFPSPTSDAIFYSAAGYARDDQGRVLGVSPYSILRLDPKDGDIQEVYADAAMDCLKYSENNRGERFMMIRPYQREQRASLKDALMAPVRLIKAIGGFLNLFTMRYGGETLRSGGPSPAQAQQKGERELFIEGNLIQADRLLKENTQRGERYPGIVPKDWQLVRLTADGGREVVQQGVIDYALLPSGGFVYTNGQYIIAHDAQGNQTALLKMPLVTRVAVISLEEPQAIAT